MARRTARRTLGDTLQHLITIDPAFVKATQIVAERRLKRARKRPPTRKRTLHK
jgi:hypothetical protein